MSVVGGSDKQGCRRPIADIEGRQLQQLGESLRAKRTKRGMSRAAVATAAQLSAKQVQRIEEGTRRTRVSTLVRIMKALGAEESLPDLLLLAGLALAPESEYAERVARRRERRHR